MSSYNLIANALHVHDLIINHRRGELTKPGMAAKLNITEKQTAKAIDFLRVMGYPAEYDEESKRWHYECTPEDRNALIDDVLAPRLKKLPKADLGILLMLQRGREFLRHTPLFAEAEGFVKLLDDGRLSVLNHQLRDMFSYQSRPARLQEGCFEAVASAVYERKQITFSYRKPEETCASERRVDPHHMTCSEEMWYLMGWDHDRKAMRTFALTRMKEVTSTGETFESIPREKIDRQLEHAFLMVGKGGNVPPRKVRLRFSPSASVRVQERQWHASQEVKKLAGGECEVTLELASLSEVESWVLSWGGHCTVLEPLELVERVRKSAHAILAKYETT
jgi:proteasome accessory factor B